MNTLGRLIAKADDNGRMPTITAISKLLTEYVIDHSVE